jgi:hypothetical protein
MCLPNVTSDGEDFRRWLEGATEPTWTRKQPWLDTLRKERENGQISTRVRILSNQVTDNERYACDFGYRYNGEYEDIRVLHRGEHEIPADLIERDFWIIGHSIVVTMYYDQHGRLDGAEVATLPASWPTICAPATRRGRRLSLCRMVGPAPRVAPKGGSLRRVPSAADDTGPTAVTRPRSLRELREAAGLNQIEVVEQVKSELPDARFSQPALSRAEQGKGRLASNRSGVVPDLPGHWY